MLAELRRLLVRGLRDAPEGDAGARQLRHRSAEEFRCRHAVAEVHLRVVLQIARPARRRHRQPRLQQHVEQRLPVVLQEDLLADRIELVMRGPTLLVRVEFRAGQQVGAVEQVAEGRPLLVAGDADEGGLAVARLEGFVDAPGARPDRDRRRDLACLRFRRDVLPDQEGAGFVQRALHMPAAARRVAPHDRREDADHAEHAAGDVHHRRPRAERPFRQARHVGEAGAVLHHFVQRGAVLVRPGQIAFQGAVDQPRVDLRDFLVADAEPLRGARGEVLRHHIGILQQPVRDLAARGRLEVQGNAPLAAIEIDERARDMPGEPPGPVAFRRRLDLDHVRPEIRQHQAAARSHDDMAEFDDLDSLQRQARVVLRSVLHDSLFPGCQSRAALRKSRMMRATYGSGTSTPPVPG